MSVLTKEQIAALSALTDAVWHGTKPARLIEDMAEDLAATVTEQQREIERLRELLGTVFARHRAQIDEPLYTSMVMEIDQ